MSLSKKLLMGSGGTGANYDLSQLTADFGTGITNMMSQKDFYDNIPGFDISSDTINTRGMDFNSDGTKVFFIVHNPTGSDDDLYICSFDLSTAYDLTSRSSFASQLIDGSVASWGSGLQFKPDGTKFFASGPADTIYEYNLSTAFDVTTLTATSNSHTFGDIQGWSFNDDGTKFYHWSPNVTNSGIEQYTLSTAWDITSTITQGTDIGFGVQPVGSSVYALGFSTDGTVLYVTGSGRMTAWNLTTAFDPSTAGTKEQNLSLNIGTNWAAGRLPIASDSSSVRMFIHRTISTGRSGIWTYRDTTQGPDKTNINNFQIEAKSKLKVPYEGLPTVDTSAISTGANIITMMFNDDGTKLVVVYDNGSSNGGGKFVSYNLDTAYDLSSISNPAQASSFTTSITGSVGTRAADFVENGSKILEYNYVTFTQDTPTSYFRTTNLATAYDITTGRSTGPSLDTDKSLASAIGSRIKGFDFNSDGTEITLLSSSIDYERAYTDSVGPTIGALLGDNVEGLLTTHSLTTAYDISTLDVSGINYAYYDYASIDPDADTGGGFEFESDGNAFHTIISENTTQITQHIRYPVHTSFGIDYKPTPEEVNYTRTENTVNYSTVYSYRSMAFNSDGTKAYALDEIEHMILQDNLSTAYDFAETGGLMAGAGNENSNIPITNRTPGRMATSKNVGNFTFNGDGTKLNWHDTANNSGYAGLYEHTLSTAYDLSSMTKTPNTTVTDVAFYVTPVANTGVTWGDSGNKFYQIVGINGYTTETTDNTIYQWDATTAYDIDTLPTTPTKSHTFGTFTSGTSTTAQKIYFKPDGTKLFILAQSDSSNTEYVFAYDLSTAWDVSSITSTTTPDEIRTLTTTEDDYNFGGLFFNSTGTQLVVAQQFSLHSFTLGTAWDIEGTFTKDHNKIPIFHFANMNTGEKRGFVAKPDGTKVFFGDLLYIASVDLDTAYDFTTMNTQNIGGGFGPYTLVEEFGSSSWRVAGAIVKDFRFNSDGTKMYTLEYRNTSLIVSYPPESTINSSANWYVAEYALSTAYDVTTASYTTAAPLETSTGYVGAGTPEYPYSFDIGPNGEFVLAGRRGLFIGTMTTAGDISTLGDLTFATVQGSSDVWSDRKWYWGDNDTTTIDRTAAAVRFSPTGDALYLRFRRTQDEAYMLKVELATAYDCNSATFVPYDGTYATIDSVSGDEPGYLNNLRFQDNGTKMFMMDSLVIPTSVRTDSQLGGHLRIRRFDLSTAYDVSTLTELDNADLTGDLNATNMTFPVSNAMAWKPNGSQVFLSTGFNIIAGYTFGGS